MRAPGHGLTGGFVQPPPGVRLSTNCFPLLPYLITGQNPCPTFTESFQRIEPLLVRRRLSPPPSPARHQDALLVFPAQFPMEVALRRSVALAARHNGRPSPAVAAALAAAPPRSRHFSLSSLTRPPPNYPGHVPLTGLEKAALAIGSGLMSLRDPRRGGKLSWFLNQLGFFFFLFFSFLHLPPFPAN